MNKAISGAETAHPLLSNFIDGRFAETGRTFENRNPVNGELVNLVREADASAVDEAVKAARRALKGPWGKMSEQERSALLRKVADGIMRRFDEFLAAEVPRYRQAGKSGVPYRHPARRCQFQRLCRPGPDTVRPNRFAWRRRMGQGALNYAIRVPRGVIGVVCPWNLPLSADDLEGRAGAGLRQYGCGQAVRGNADHRELCSAK